MSRYGFLQVQLIVSSPLTRCLETAAGVFGVHPAEGGNGASNGATNGAAESSSRGVWMNATEHEEGKCTQHVPIGLPSVPVIAHETCRETLGVRYPITLLLSAAITSSCHSGFEQALSCCSLLPVLAQPY